jgi:hypothetical protein
VEDKTMFIVTDSGWIAGLWDLLAIVRDTSTGRFHVYAFYEAPPPGPYNPDLEFVRLKSKMHHTTGATTFEEALGHLAETRKKIQIADDNVWSRIDQVLERDCSESFADVIVVPRWKPTSQVEILAANLFH